MVALSLRTRASLPVPCPKSLCGIPVSGGQGAQEGGLGLNCVTDLGLQPWELHSDPGVPTWQRLQFSSCSVVTPGPCVLEQFAFTEKVGWHVLFSHLEITR